MRTADDHVFDAATRSPGDAAATMLDGSAYEPLPAVDALLIGVGWLLAECGACPTLSRSAGPAGPLELTVAGETIQCCEIGTEHVLLTESGSVLGFVDDPGVINELIQICQHEPDQRGAPTCSGSSAA
jgi:hypothetical protein